MPKPPFDLVQRQHVLSAIAEIDAKGVPLHRQARGFDVVVGDKAYPPKYLLSLAGQFATGAAFDHRDFSGGEETNAVLRKLGFEVRPREVQNLRDNLERVLAEYTSARTSETFTAHPLRAVLNSVSKTLQDIEAISSRPNLVVKWSMGQGNWAKVPWIAILDTRETTTTQRGVYCVFLFRQDMAGVYLTLAQGVTEPKRARGSAAARDFLKSNAVAVRPGLAGLTELGFQLDDAIDLHAEPDYADSTIAYKFYEAGHIPDDDALESDIDAIVSSYDAYVSANATGGKVWLFQANPAYYDLTDALSHLKQQTWLVSSYRNEIREGDTVYLWESGPQGGLLGSATVISEPMDREFKEDEKPFIKEPLKFDGVQVRALLRIDRVFKHRLLRRDLLNDEILKNLAVIRMANATNFKVTSEQAARIEQLLEQTEGGGSEPIQPEVTSDSWAELRSVTFFATEQLQEIEYLLQAKRQMIFEGPPGSGKTYIAKLIARHFAGIPLTGGADHRVRIVQFHQSYGYEDFILGIRPETNGGGQIQYAIKPGIFKRLCDEAGKSDTPFVIVIDEINRGNISRIFGELLLLLEYRDLEIELPYDRDGELFSIPPNVFVIGTMNTTDRSLAQIDYALRRRFFFYRLMPVTAGAAPVLRKWLELKSGLSQTVQEEVLALFLNLNERIQKELGEHFQIGHSYFMDARIGTAVGRKQVWDFAIMPLLEEYFYNRRDRATLLNEFAIEKLLKANAAAQAAGV